MAPWNFTGFPHLGESVFCRNVCAGDRKASVSGTFSVYSAVSAPLRENPDEESRVNKGLPCSNTEVFMSWPHAKFAKYAKWPTSFPLRTLRTLREVESPRSVSQASTWITVKNADAPLAAKRLFFALPWDGGNVRIFRYLCFGERGRGFRATQVWKKDEQNAD